MASGIDPSEWIGYGKAIAAAIIEQRGLPSKWHDDVYGEAMLQIVQAAEDCDGRRRTRFRSFLSGYLDRRLRHFIRGLMRGEVGGSRHEDLDRPCTRRVGHVPPPTEQQLAELAAAVKRLPPKQRKAIEAVYLKSRSQAEHGRRIGVSQRQVSRLLKMARASLAKTVEG